METSTLKADKEVVDSHLKKRLVDNPEDLTSLPPRKKDAQLGDGHQQKNRELLLGSAKSATYNILLQLCLRLMSFFLNAVVLHHVSTDLLGVVNVRLLLLYSTTLFISTEGFDQACLSKLENKDWRQIINLSWCTVPVSCLVSGVLSTVWIFFLEAPDPHEIPHYYLGVVSYAASTIITCIARPHFIVGQAFLWVKLRVSAVAVSELVRVVITVVLVLKFPWLGIVSFSIAQIIHSLIYTAIYYVTFFINIDGKEENLIFTEIRDFFPQKPKNKPWLNREQTVLAKNFFASAIFKQILTEGEKYVMTVFGVLNFSDQGIYEVINNLGSLVPRFVFKPIEESGYVLFSQSLKRGQRLQDNTKEAVEMTTKVLTLLIRTVTLIGCIILVFGQSYSYLFLDWYGGKKISAGPGPLLLKWYSVYVLFLAVNGVTECYYLATMGNEEISSYNKKLLVFSGVLLASTLALTRMFGSVGFIIANCINMGTRICHSMWYIEQCYKTSHHSPVRSLVMSKAVILSLVLSYCITQASEKYFCCSYGFLYQLVHVGIGAICFFSVLLVIWLKEPGIWVYVLEQYKAHKRTSPKNEGMKKE
ncbi:hypothetical protein FSP39_018642 [Pinctada imbricata]|uniref:Protein RFT1 homolog n=1 Tax=Pinctada imbricata TaxID=66713 RepID=A0AA88YLP4_PINIB|nr:hypothetical protein FSP39_018642 [Pinctada imbricata]